MIKDRFGYDGTKRLLGKVQTALDAIRKDDPEKAKTSELLYEIEQLHGELKEFEDTISGEAPLPDIDQISRIPKNLIKWRLAKHWSKEELAAKADVDFVHLIAWEMHDYKSCTFEEMMRIVRVLQMQTPENPFNELTDE